MSKLKRSCYFQHVSHARCKGQRQRQILHHISLCDRLVGDIPSHTPAEEILPESNGCLTKITIGSRITASSNTRFLQSANENKTLTEPKNQLRSRSNKHKIHIGSVTLLMFIFLHLYLKLDLFPLDKLIYVVNSIMTDEVVTMTHAPCWLESSVQPSSHTT